jgi:hypothetical protein
LSLLRDDSGEEWVCDEIVVVGGRDLGNRKPCHSNDPPRFPGLSFPLAIAAAGDAAAAFEIVAGAVVTAGTAIDDARGWGNIWRRMRNDVVFTTINNTRLDLHFRTLVMGEMMPTPEASTAIFTKVWFLTFMDHHVGLQLVGIRKSGWAEFA